MQASDTILICGTNSQQVQQLVTIFEFIGESVRCLDSVTELTELLSECNNEQFRTVIIDDSVSANAKSICDAFLRQPFLFIGVNDQLELGRNIIGQIQLPFKYAQLTQELHNSQDFLNKRPTTMAIAGSQSMLFRSLVGRSEKIQYVRVIIEQVE